MAERGDHGDAARPRLPGRGCAEDGEKVLRAAVLPAASLARFCRTYAVGSKRPGRAGADAARDTLERGLDARLARDEASDTAQEAESYTTSHTRRIVHST